jgi:hypothetical protein
MGQPGRGYPGRRRNRIEVLSSGTGAALRGYLVSALACSLPGMAGCDAGREDGSITWRQASPAPSGVR